MSLRARRRERRQYKADPLGLNQGPLLQAVPDPEPAEDTSPTLADLSSWRRSGSPHQP